MSNDILKNQYLTVANVGRYLNISQSKAYELAHRKDFPVCRFGGSIRIPREAYLRQSLCSESVYHDGASPCTHQDTNDYLAQ